MQDLYLGRAIAGVGGQMKAKKGLSGSGLQGLFEGMMGENKKNGVRVD